MEEITLVSDLIRLCKNVSVYGELITLVELSKNQNYKQIIWLGGSRHLYDIECDGKRIEVKSCNVNNDWAERERRKDPSFESGFDHINPRKLDYVVCVCFTKDFQGAKFYVFTSEEVKMFEKSNFGRSFETYVIEIRKHNDDRRNTLIKNSLDAWDKIQ